MTTFHMVKARRVLRSVLNIPSWLNKADTLQMFNINKIVYQIVGGNCSTIDVMH